MWTRVAGTYERLHHQLNNNGATFTAGTPEKPGNGKVVASADNIAKISNDELVSHNVAAEKDLTFLGIDYSAANAVAFAKARQRVKGVQLKGMKIASDAKGGRRVFNTMRSHVLSPTMNAGRVNGIPDNVVDQIDTTVGSAAFTEAKGDSATMDLLLQNRQHIDTVFSRTRCPCSKGVSRLILRIIRIM